MGNVTKSGSSNTIRKPVDTKPIDKDDLVAAYLERHRDSDYGFQAEFEQLPTSFADRTTGKTFLFIFSCFLRSFIMSKMSDKLYVKTIFLSRNFFVEPKCRTSFFYMWIM